MADVVGLEARRGALELGGGVGPALALLRGERPADRRFRSLVELAFEHLGRNREFRRGSGLGERTSDKCGKDHAGGSKSWLIARRMASMSRGSDRRCPAPLIR